MSSRFASEQEVEAWRTDGWVLLDGLISTDEIDAATDDMNRMFPTNEDFHADPEKVTEKWLGHPAQVSEEFVWPENGPGFRPDQHIWQAKFPFPGDGILNRLCVHPSIADFAERALGSQDIRLYQIHATAKYAGVVDYEQPMHTDRNHSWLPAIGKAPWWNLEGFLYMTDVTEAENPTLMVPLSKTREVPPKFPVLMPGFAPEIYASELPAVGIRGSYLAYRSDTFHRGSAFRTSGTSRTVIALAWKQAAHEWIGYDGAQSRSTGSAWTTFVEGSSPRELELLGFPPPGHEVWSEELLAETQIRYPKLDLGPWRRKLKS